MGRAIEYIITKETTTEEHLKQYSQYPETIKGGLEENPYNESRIKPNLLRSSRRFKVLDIVPIMVSSCFFERKKGVVSQESIYQRVAVSEAIKKRIERKTS